MELVQNAKTNNINNNQQLKIDDVYIQSSNAVK